MKVLDVIIHVRLRHCTVLVDVDLSVEQRTRAVKKQTGLDCKSHTLGSTSEFGNSIYFCRKILGSLIELSAYPVHQSLPVCTVNLVDVLCEKTIRRITVEEGRTIVLHHIEIIVCAKESCLCLILSLLLCCEFRATVNVLHKDTCLTDTVVHVSVFVS